MLRFIVIATFIGLAVAGCSSAPRQPVAKTSFDSTTIRHQGSVYHRLTGPTLKAAIVGKSMFVDKRGPEIVVVSGDGQYFSSDGCSYARNADRIGRIFGNYTVKDDHVCIKTGGYLSCFELFQSGEDRWLVRGLSASSGYCAVVLAPDPGNGGSCPLIDPFYGQ